MIRVEHSNPLDVRSPIRNAMLAGWIALLASAAAAETLEIHQLEPQLARYEGQTVEVLGRFRSSNGQRLRLVGSDIEFRLNSNVRVPRPSPSHVAVAGQLARDARGWYLAVRSVFRRPSEQDEYAHRVARLATDDYATRFEQYGWLMDRARWYDDPTLRGTARQCLSESVVIYEQSLARRGNWAGMLAMMTWAGWSGLDPAEIQRLAHRVIWTLRESQPAGDDRTLLRAERLARAWLPASAAPLTVPVAEPAAVDRQAYLAHPLTAFAQAGASQRREMSRWLMIDLVGRRLQAGETRPGADLNELARDATIELPDVPGLVGAWQLRAARRLALQPERLDRAGLRETLETLRRLEKPDEAAAALDAWFLEQKERLATTDALGHGRLATFYLEQGGDEAKAVSLLEKALQIQSPLAEAEATLRRLGYRPHRDGWRKLEERPEDRGESPLPQIEAGDGESQVLKLLDRPSRVVRTYTSSELLEQWVYEGPPRLIVYLRRQRSADQGRVVSVFAP